METAKKTFNGFTNYLSLVKFSHTIFALPFAMLGVTMGFKDIGRFDPMKLVYVILCMIFARTAAMAFNRWIDRDFDSQNPRTSVREIPSGILKSDHVIVFVTINCILFIISTYFINLLCFFLSPVALAVVLGYSYTKRFTSLCHLILGLGLSLAPVGAYIAVTENFEIKIIMIGCSVLTWVAGFDIIYALQDDKFDRSNGLNSIPAYLGRENALRLSQFLHLISWGVLVQFGLSQRTGLIYWIGVFFFAILLLYQHSLVKSNDLSKVNLAFFTTNGVASVVFCILAIVDITRIFY